MSPTRFLRIQELALAASELPATRQAGFVRDSCGEDAELEAEVLSLLRHVDTPKLELDDRTFQSVVAATAAALAEDESDEPVANPALPERVGRYRIQRKIGEGGMGTVYEAMQENPRRVVALKVVRPGATSDSILRRFRHEAQILGQLRHPAIAQIYEAGVSDAPAASGETVARPFFAMELICGTPIDSYARSRALTARDRLELFASVCDGVHFAHGKGVIHRDLKPGNILIDEFGRPKILDFGIARVTNADVTTIQTEVGQIVGTLGYMSPEQVSGRPQDVDPRSDVYAMGIVLYELVAGRLPYDVRGQTIPEAARIIREEEPSRLSSIDPHLRGDVETIVSKALEKDAARRYASAGELAADVRRFLRDEPIVARPASTFYQMRKFARRHRGFVGGACATVLALILGLIGTIWFAVGESQQRRLSDQRADDARRLAYRASLGAAQAAIEGRHCSMAAAALHDTTESLRGWEWRYLHWALRRGRREYTLPAAYVRCVRAMPDGIHALAGGDDGVLRVIHPETGRVEQEIKACDEPILSAVASPDARWIALVTQNEGLVVDARQGGRVLKFPERPLELGDQCFSSDGRRIAVGLPQSRQISLYDVASGVCEQTIPVSERIRNLVEVCMNPDADLLAAGVGINVQVHDIQSGRQLWQVSGWSPTFALGGRALLSAEYNRVSVLEPHSGSELGRVDGPLGGALRVRRTSADGESLFTLDTTGTWTRHDLQPVASNASWLDDMTAADCVTGQFVMAVALSDGVVEKQVHVWDSRVSDSPYFIAGPDGMGAICAATNVLARGQWGCVTLIEARTGRELAARIVHRHAGSALQFSPDGRWLASAAREPELAMIDVANARIDRRISGICKAMTAIAWSRDGRSLYAAGDDSHLRIFNVPDFEVVRTLPGDGQSIQKMAASPDGRLLATISAATGSRGNTLSVCDTQNGNRILVKEGEGHGFTCVLFLPDSVHLLAGTGSGSLELWDSRSGQRVGRYAGADRMITTLALHPDGTRIAAGAGDTAICIWDRQTFELLVSLRSPHGAVSEMAFTPDGTTLLACAAAGGVLAYETMAQDRAVYEQREIHRRAARVLSSPGPTRLVSDAIAAVQADPHVPAAVRAEALRVAGSRDDHVNYLNSMAWDIARAPNRTSEEYAYALRLSEGACRAWPDHRALLNTLGIAQYRVGKLDEARATLERCTQMYASPDEGQPSDWLFLAIIEHKLGRPEQARAHYEHARRLMSRPSFVMDTEHESFAEEARARLALE